MPAASASRRGLVVLVALAACGPGNAQKPPPAAAAPARPSILLVTMDTTRWDAVGHARPGDTGGVAVLESRGRRFTQAYAAVPETLPSHTSIMTGLYPRGHGVHQNARYVPATVPVAAEQLQHAGYRTAAFVSAYVLNRRFGLARGFDVYDDQLAAGRNERNARETTDAAIRELESPSAKPRFVWVHYYDPHAPYDPPPGYRRDHPYLGEVDFMEAQLGRLSQAFTTAAGAGAVEIVVADHGEGLGEHGEAQHGRLLYQGTMHVPLVIVGPGMGAGEISAVPVSTRRVFNTILDFAGLARIDSLRDATPQPVLGEAMGPFLEYGWQPQVMSVSGRDKAILSARLETYDLDADPGETHDLGSGVALAPGARKSLEDYPVPSPAAAHAPAALDQDAARRLAALGYVAGGAAPIVRTDAPRPADMTALFPVMDEAAALFEAAEYRQAVPVLQKILAVDPHNLDAQLRLATSYSSLGRDALAVEAFQKAAAMAPDSQDVRTYLALHYARTKDWERAVPLLEQVVKADPDRATAVEALGRLHAREAAAAMDRGDTPSALAAFERARQLQGPAFANDLELGVLYLDAHRFEDARAALDRALAARPADPMALFKRAQVSVLLKDADAPARIAAARAHADAVTTPLIARERLFSDR